MDKIKTGLETFFILNQSEKEILKFIWDYFWTNADWPSYKATRKYAKTQFGLTTASDILNKLQPVFIKFVNNPPNDTYYFLTIEGIVGLQGLSGEFITLISKYFDYLKNQFNHNPDVKNVTSSELEQIFTDDELLKLLLYIHQGNFWGRSASGLSYNIRNPGHKWEVGIINEIEELDDSESSQEFLFSILRRKVEVPIQESINLSKTVVNKSNAAEKMNDSTDGKKYVLLCNNCSAFTNHIVQKSHNVDWEHSDDRNFIFGNSINEIVECLGCEVISFRKEEFFSEDYISYRDQVIDDGKRETLYPRRSSADIVEKCFFNLPDALSRLYTETVTAYNNNSLTLTAAGLRALVEGLCAHLGIKDGEVEGKRKTNLEGKINGLMEAQYLTPKDAGMLHEHRYLGNEALHQLAIMSKEELKIGIEIIVHVLESLFVIPEKVEIMKKHKQERKGKG